MTRSSRHALRRSGRKLRCEALESRRLLAADLAMAHHNHFEPCDVNDDGAVSAIDALSVINLLNRQQAHAQDTSGMFLDVNNDGRPTALDALMIINRLNRGDSNGANGASPGENNGGSRPPQHNTEVRSIDGTGNNLSNAELGSTDEALLRVAPAEYADGISAPAGADRPSTREISNVLSAHDDERVPNENDLSAFLYVWGQFIDHDIDFTDTQTGGETLPINVPQGDAWFDPSGTGAATIPFSRSQFDPTTGTSIDNPRQQSSEITAWLDASMVYGSDAETADSLREFVGGRMLVSDNNMLPIDDAGMFVAGDVRANENTELTAIQTLFVREHNYWAAKFAAENPALTDEQLYQQARAVVIAEIQSITYNEYLPGLLGKQAIDRYQGYDATVDPTIANEFSTAAFRFGHSTLNDDIGFFDNNGRGVREEVPLSEVFFNPALLGETGIDSVLKYVASSQAEEVDLLVVDSLRNLLFGEPGQGGLDLVALNIQRGRDHGLADYNAVREAYSLKPVDDFSDITTDEVLQTALSELYGSVDDIDLWIGILAEDHMRDAAMGELGVAIIADQFERIRDGDRLWYENVFRGNDLRAIQQTKLSDIIERNTTITGLQKDVFTMRAEVTGTVRPAVAPSSQANAPNGLDVGRPNARPNVPTNQGAAGVTVELLDATGEVIESTTTDSKGRYRLTNFVETGDYSVRVVLSDATNSDPIDFLVANGSTRLLNLDFSI